MKNFEEVEKELNKYPDPTNFHDMSIVNFIFFEDSLKIRFVLANYMDLFSITKKDNQNAILEVTYEEININSLRLEGLVDLRSRSVFELFEDEDGFMVLNLGENKDGIYFNIRFSFVKYKWKVIDVVNEKNLTKYEVSYQKHLKRLFKNRIEMPYWSKFENEKFRRSRKRTKQISRPY